MQKIAVLDNEGQRVFIRNLTPDQAKAMAGDDEDAQCAVLEHFEETLHVNIQNQEWMAGEIALDSESDTEEGVLGGVSVSNMTSPRGNREVPNQFEIYTPQGTYFQSYRSVIAFIPRGGGKTVLDESKWDYSTTTGKYRNQFLGESKPETEKKIKSGVYVLANLNGK